MSDASYQPVSAVRQRLRAAQRRYAAAAVLFGLVLCLGLGAALVLTGAALESILWMGIGLRTLFFWTFTLSVAGLAIFWIVLPLLRLLGVVPGSDERAAVRWVAHRHPDVADRLAALLDLADGRMSSAPDALRDRALTSLSESVSPIPFERVENLKPTRRVAPWAFTPVIGIVFFLAAAPTAFTGAVDRLFTPAVAFQPPAPFRIKVLPGDTELTHGEALSVEAELILRDSSALLPIAGALLETVRVGEKVSEHIRLVEGADGHYRHTLANVRADLRYRITADKVVSPWFSARVVERPVVRGLKVTLQPPRYSGLPTQELAPGFGDVQALPGTTVRVAMDASDVPLKTSTLNVVWAEHAPQSIALRRDGKLLEGAFTLKGTGTYTLRLEGQNGRANEQPIQYTLETLRDAPPEITLLEGADLPLDTHPRSARFRLTDDFGFAGATLYWRPASDSAATWSAILLTLARRELDQDISLKWLPRGAEEALQPGDAVAFFGEVRDNDTVLGPKRSRTPVYTLRFPSVDEQFERLSESHDAVQDGIESIDREAESMRERFRELRDDLRRDPQPNWEDQRQLERLQGQRQSVQEQAESLSSQMQDMVEKMQQNRLVSEETQQLYESMQRVIDELESPELQEALDQLRQAMEKMDLSGMMESLEAVEFNEKDFQERIERALKLFEKLRTAQELDEAAARAADLAQREETLQKSTERLQERSETPPRSPDEHDAGEAENNTQEPSEEKSRSDESPSDESPSEDSSSRQQEDDQQAAEQRTSDQQGPEQAGDSQAGDSEAEREQLAQNQEQARKEMEALEALIQSLAKKMEGQSGTPPEFLEEMRQQAQQQLSEQMQQNAQQLRQNELQDAQKGQQQLQQQLQELSEQLSSASSEMMEGRAKQSIQGLRRVLDDVLTLSEEQERLGDRSGALPSQSSALRPVAQQQVELAEGLATVGDTLRALSRSIPQMSQVVQRIRHDALTEMRLATERLAALQSGPAAGHQKLAMTHLNDLALMLSELMDQLSSGSGSGGSLSPQQMMQQMQQMGQGQQQLNGEIQQMLNSMAGERLTQSQQEQARQAAARQAGIRRQLQELIEQGRESLDAKSRSALQRTIDNMHETERELRGGRLSQETVERQQQIFQRLLQAEDALSQRGREEKREGQTGEDRPNPDAPESLDAPEREADRLRRDLIRALESGYALDYQELIKRYFDRLQERNGS